MGRLVPRVFGVAALVLSLLGAACTGNDETAAPTSTPEATTTTRATAAATAPAADCEPNGPFTPAQTEGPYFKAGSPQKTDFYAEAGSGTKLVLTGLVVSTDCTPVSGAKVDFWQADGEGAYDNQGFRLRGHQITGDDGRYELTTVVPGEYPGRTPHIHVKVQPRTGAALTTQLYMPGESQNESDSIFRPELVMKTRESKDGTINATFTFVVVIA